MTSIDLGRFPLISHWIDGTAATSNEHWCFAHPSLPYVSPALVTRVRGEVTISVSSCSLLQKRSVAGVRMAAETLLAACEFASKLNASHSAEQTSRVGNGNELDGDEMKSADGATHQPLPESPHSSAPIRGTGTDWTSESEVAQAPRTRSLAEVAQ